MYFPEIVKACRSGHVRSTEKFRSSASGGTVGIVRETGNSIADVAGDLGANAGTLVNWAARDRREHQGTQRLSAGEVTVLMRLCTEVAELRTERDVLKRSVVLRVKETSK